jgi:hypothetical protein
VRQQHQTEFLLQSSWPKRTWLQCAARQSCAAARMGTVLGQVRCGWSSTAFRQQELQEMQHARASSDGRCWGRMEIGQKQTTRKQLPSGVLTWYTASEVRLGCVECSAVVEGKCTTDVGVVCAWRRRDQCSTDVGRHPNRVHDLGRIGIGIVIGDGDGEKARAQGQQRCVSDAAG